MMKITFFVCFLLSTNFLLAQSNVETLISEGIKLYDEGKYDDALKKYDEALSEEPNNYTAGYEKSSTLIMLGKYEDCIALCKQLIAKNGDNPQLYGAFINYGTALDQSKKPDEAVKIYSEGLKKFPKSNLLWFNKGITLLNMGETEEATEAFKNDIALKPLHSSAHHALAIIFKDQNKVAAILAGLTYLAIDNESKRAKVNLDQLEALLGANVKKVDEKNTTITLSADLFSPKSKKEDDFHITEMTMSLATALDNDEKYKNETAVERIQRKIELLISSLSEKKKAKGYFSQHYVPFFTELKKNDDLLKAYCHLIYKTANDEANNKWLEQNADKIDALKKWVNEYKWE